MASEIAGPMLMNQVTSAPPSGALAGKDTIMTVTARRSAVTRLVCQSAINKLVFRIKVGKGAPDGSEREEGVLDFPFGAPCRTEERRCGCYFISRA